MILCLPGKYLQEVLRYSNFPATAGLTDATIARVFCAHLHGSGLFDISRVVLIPSGQLRRNCIIFGRTVFPSYGRGWLPIKVA
jgi:hypothetical protein